jgi:hypothetical protein
MDQFSAWRIDEHNASCALQRLGIPKSHFAIQLCVHLEILEERSTVQP